MFVTKQAWRTTDEVKFRNFITNRYYIEIIDSEYKLPEIYSTGHAAAKIACNMNYNELDIYGCDSYFTDTVKSYTNDFVVDINIDSEQQRINTWRLHWDTLQKDYPHITFNFIKP